LPAALAAVAKIKSEPQSREALDNIAGRLAESSPAESERVLEMIDSPVERSVALMRICQRMASVDPARAQRLVAAARGDEFRAQVLMFLALGQKERDKNAAMASFRAGIRALDRMVESPCDIRQCWEIAGLLPVAEQIDPPLVPRIFRRALAARPPWGDPRQEIDSSSSVLPMFLCRYDCEVAVALLAPIAAELEQEKDAGASRSLEFLALALIDPRRAVTLVERLPITGDLSPNTNWVRIRLAETLASLPEARWRAIWRSRSSLGGILFDRDYR